MNTRAMGIMIPRGSVEEPTTITNLEFCDHCGKRNMVGDSFTMREDGKVLRCEHWPPIKQNVQTY